MGMGNKMGVIEIDDRGRITIPKEERERLGLTPGQKAIIREKDGALIIKRFISPEKFISELKACITVEAHKIDPLELKTIWGPHL
ncbi:MAG: AbrB/MazE/SpoVT family DNA-binding domain-containing protein [Candidatus Heimdallarchaeota archaeon]|nr:AbrB/MazE/SpoVT family DNA-binding domain-containing protein [Candidatus Heimdallarchaeota archaeon]